MTLKKYGCGYYIRVSDLRQLLEDKIKELQKFSEISQFDETTEYAQDCMLAYKELLAELSDGEKK